MFNKAEAVELGRLAKIAYCVASLLGPWTNRHCLKIQRLLAEVFSISMPLERPALILMEKKTAAR